jgi:hypothetical protein
MGGIEGVPGFKWDVGGPAANVDEVAGGGQA